MSTDKPTGQLMILMPESTYRAEPFMNAARKLGLAVIVASDRCQVLADYWGVPLALNLQKPRAAVEEIVEYAKKHRIDAIVPVDDATTVVAASACEALSLPHNRPEAAAAARNKRVMKKLLKESGVPSAEYHVIGPGSDLHAAAECATYPCVLKPLLLSASRGVIRADTESEFVAAGDRILQIISQNEIPEPNTTDGKSILVEQYLPGREVAVEGVLTEGSLRVLAVFDKPDPLEGPYFEETIYTTPSRLPESTIQKAAKITETATAALGLTHGPVHAELRIHGDDIGVIEVAGRSIGGLCSRTLQFGLGISLEELILRQAFGYSIDDMTLNDRAAGVMMLPVPAAGILKSISGIEQARSVDGIEDVVITAREGETLVPLPEGSSYPGFIFSRGDTPWQAETALRKAYKRIRFHVAPELPTVS